MRNFILLSILSVNLLSAQNFSEKSLDTKIEEVTVFLQGAQIYRTGKITLKPGTVSLIVENLSPYVDTKSIQAKATGDFTILSVNHRYNFLAEKQRDLKMDSLEQKINEVQTTIDLAKAQQQVLKEQVSLLNKNKFLGSDQTAVTLERLKSAMSFYYRELNAINQEDLKLTLQIEQKIEVQKKLENQMALIQQEEGLPAVELEIRIEALQSTLAEFNISYLVANAGWFPKYDVRVKDITSPIQLGYKAEVYQNTGIDWNEVKLKFSNADPNKSGQVPQLQTWYLNYLRNTVFEHAEGIYGSRIPVREVSGVVKDAEGSPLPGVNIVVKGTTTGTISDITGRYNLSVPPGANLVFSSVGFISVDRPISGPVMNISMQEDVTQLDDVVVTAYGLQGRASGIRVRGVSSIPARKAEIITTTTIENQTTVEIEVEKPYTIKSEAEQLLVDLKKFELQAIYQYYAVPKLDKDAFLVARIVNWDQYNLLEGEANLYFEDAYVGRSLLNAKSLEDTLDISLGRDRSLVIAREPVDVFTRRKFIGGNKIETRAFKITVRNQKSQPVNIQLFDQIPTPAISEISVAPEELSSGRFDEKTGAVTWELDLEPKDQRELRLGYQVKYPKREKVLLE